ncbi:glycosyltransferase [Herbaspirillum sp. CF444]|uniref:glycosyltransferase family protein n=1 Tax=Herbaspirillum sp. CF444 TaxID=1144319 RepID=UPI000272342B|nr:glycosyltransferase [Herbaspirillum sp. CF444]EJL83425.1 glycosyltransferase [Herbaspirillum sp. CF444]
MTRKKRILIYTVESTWSPCPQIRLIRPFAHLEDEWELIWGIRNGVIMTDAVDGADLILMHRFTPGLLPISALEAIFNLGKPVVYESDDLLNDIPHDHPEAAAGASWKEGIEYTARRARAIVVSTEFLAEKYRPLNPRVHVLPNYLDFDLFFRPVPAPLPGDTITIGLLGSSIQPSNFALVNKSLQALCERYGARLKIHFVGWECPKGWENHPNAIFQSFIHEYVDYAAQLKQWAWNIALIPLASDEYNQCKSYIKWLDYSAAGIASVFSDVTVYNQVVTHDRTGFLLPNDDQAWLDTITQLIESPEKRKAIAEAGQDEVRRDFDLRAKATLYDTVYGSLTDKRESIAPATPAVSAAPAAPAAATSTTDAVIMKKNILQIHYNEATRRSLDPGFIPLEVVGNPRPDWFEFWAIRDYFLSNALNADEYYGFLSPQFHNKSGLQAHQVHALMDANPGADVYTFSPTMSDAACYLSVFEQGNRRHPELLPITIELMRAVGLEVDIQNLINDFRTTVFCNYIVAKPVFWEKWFAINERMFEIAEAGDSALARKLTEITDYGKSTVQMKVFIMERIASLVLALMPELQVVNLNIGVMRIGNPLFYPCRDEMVTLDALKVAYQQSRDNAYLQRFRALRHDVLRRCDTEYFSEQPTDFF